MKPNSGAAAGVLVAFLFLISCGGKDESAKVDSTASSPSPVVSSPVAKEATPAEGDCLLAEWKGGKITLAQIDKISLPAMALYIKDVTDESIRFELIKKKRRSDLDLMVENYLLIQEARARNLQLSDADKEKILKEMRGKFNTKEEYEAELKKSGQTEEGLLQIFTNINLGRMCVENEQKKIQATITPQVLKDYYNAHIQDKFSPPARTDINWVVIKKTDRRPLDEAKLYAEKLYAEVRSKVEKLEKLEEKRKVLQDCAKEYSDDFTGKYNYGFLNLYQRGEGWDELDPAFRAEIEKRKKPGELSDVVKIDDQSYGFFLVYYVIGASVTPFESQSVQDMLPNMYILEKMDQWRRQLRKNYELKIYEENFSVSPAFIPSATLP